MVNIGTTSIRFDRSVGVKDYVVGRRRRILPIFISKHRLSENADYLDHVKCQVDVSYLL